MLKKQYFIYKKYIIAIHCSINKNGDVVISVK